MFQVIAKKHPRLKVWKDGKVVAEFTPSLRHAPSGDYMVGEFETNDEKLVKYILKSCVDSQVSVRKVSSAKLNTLD